MADIAKIVQGFPGVAPLPGVDDAWTWSLGTMFTYGLALTPDGSHAVQINMRGASDPELMAAVLSFARQRSAEVLAAVPFAVLDGFEPPTGRDYRFDTVGAVWPAVYNVHAKNPELGNATYLVFPAWRCEFSGRESEIEAKARIKMLNAADLNRLPSPFLQMRFDNPKTGGGSIGTEFGLAQPDLLYSELRKLDQADGAWVEFRNFQNKQRRAYWQDGLLLANNAEDGREIEQIELLTYARQFLYEGVDDDS